MFEHRSKALARRPVFYKRLLTFWILGSVLILFSLAIGTAGYMHFGRMNLVDGFYNASMILTGMGPAEQNPEQSLKVFASFYALYSGVVFLSCIAIVMAPIVHRFFHMIHLDDKS